MNRSSSGSSGLSLSKALVGFLHAKAAEGLSPRPLDCGPKFERSSAHWGIRAKPWIGGFAIFF